MCSRINQINGPAYIARVFEAALTHGLAERQPQYNIAPSTAVMVIRMADVGPVLELMRWGLIPHWSREPSTKFATFNARCEEAAEKATYRGPMRYRRCLVPVDGFYEWQKLEDGSKQPWLIRMADDQPFALAGLWDTWQDELQSFSILTTRANEMMSRLHTRMPVILMKEDHARWLDHRVTDPAAVADLMTPFPSELMYATPVSAYVNNTRNQGPLCVDPLA